MLKPNATARELALAVLLSLTAAASPAAFDLRQGVVVDDNRGAAYVGGNSGGVVAVDLASGRTLWTSSDAALPLALHGNLIAAQADDGAAHLRIVVLDAAAKGRKITQSVTPLPDDVRALVSDDLGRSFRATAKYERDGFAVEWKYRETIIQGIAREPGAPLPERKLSGTAFVRVRSRGSTKVARDRCASAATAERLRSRCSGAPLRDRSLSENALTALASADSRHLLVVERVGKGTEADPEYRWSIVSLETGETIGTVRRNTSAAPFLVWKGIIVFVSQPHGFLRGEEWIDVPLEIVAIRLSTGETVWRRAVRDLEYRGPMPPTS